VSTVINTNMASLFAQNSLANAQNNLATSVQRLSSGLRINSAKDDAAGLAISQSMQGQINGTNQSIRNLSDATNLLQTADSSLATIQDMLLRLKQLAVQGYDGSLSATQKLDIVNEMKDLNDEINSTAQRTAFNGIDLLSSGASVDATNSDMYSGQELVTTVVAITASSAATSLGTGLGSSGLLAVSAGAAGLGASYTLTISDDYKKRMAGLGYTLSSAGDNLTMTGTLDGQAVSQTVALKTIVGESTSAETHSQTLDFSSFGTSIVLDTVTSTTGTITGTSIASAFAAKTSLSLTGLTGQLSDVNLSGVQTGTYTLTNTAGVLKMSGTINGAAVTQELTLTTVSANTTTTFDFASFGVSFDVKAYGNALSGTFIGATLANLNEGTQTASGSLVLSQGQNSALEFQSGATSDAYITVDTLNVMTGSSGSTAGSTNEMKAVGTAISSTSSTSYLGGLNASNDISTWQSAFQSAESAIDTALDFISTQRGVYGSQMNRLNYISTNLSTQSTNLQNSRSAIIDTDFAAETAKLTKGQIMQQAATAMLAQANQMPNVVLSLLK